MCYDIFYIIFVLVDIQCFFLSMSNIQRYKISLCINSTCFVLVSFVPIYSIFIRLFFSFLTFLHIEYILSINRHTFYACLNALKLTILWSRARFLNNTTKEELVKLSRFAMFIQNTRKKSEPNRSFESQKNHKNHGTSTTCKKHMEHATLKGHRILNIS